MKTAVLFLLVFSTLAEQSFAADIETAVRRGLERVQRAAVNWHSNADCFSCHHHTLPMLASFEGLQVGLQIDTKKLVREAILVAQQNDGGWAETKERPSDALSTGQTIFTLCNAGTSPDDPAITRGRDFLLRTQYADGSWKFESHVKPVQPFFNNGDPHGKNQFISVAATAWATSALVQLMPPMEP